MTLLEIADRMDLRVLTTRGAMDVDVAGGYSGDLLSHVLSSTRPGWVWITIQHHANVVGVARVAELAGVVFASGVQPVQTVVEQAEEMGVVLLRSDASAFELAGRLYPLVQRGSSRASC